MEEQMIQDFVHRVLRDEELRKELARDPQSVIARASFPGRVARVLTRMVPQLAFDAPLEPLFTWW